MEPTSQSSTKDFESEVEQLVTNTQVISNGDLRCVISLGNSGICPHFFVCNVNTKSKMSMIIRFPGELQTDLETFKKKLADKSKNKMTAA